MDTQQLGAVIDRYLSGTATAVEKAWVEKWLAQRPEDDSLLSPPHREAVHARLWEAFTEHCGWQPAPAKTRVLPRTWLAYAAAVAILVACGFWLQRSRQPGPAAPPQIIAALPGSQKKVTLPDSTVAHLFPGATLAVPEDFNTARRRVAVTGRVFFAVKTDPSKPFLVTAGKLHTHVLGTSFEVMAADSLHPSVTVRSGKVGVQYDGRLLAELTPGKRLRYNAQHSDFIIDEVNTGLLCEWWDHGLVFHQAPLAEVVRALSDWYNVPITIAAGKWETETVTVRIKRQSCAEAVALLSRTLGFRYKKENDRIIIY